MKKEKRINKQEIKSDSPLNYLKKSKKEIKIIIIIFIFSILIGFLNAENLAEIENLLKSLIEQTSNLKGIELIGFILVNNTFSSFLGMILGIFLGIFPIITTISNGVILGYVLKRTAESVGVIEFWRLFPHGIFELPAVFISLGLGLKLGKDIIKNYLKTNKKNRSMQFLGIISIILPIIGIIILRSIIINAPQNTIYLIYSILSFVFSFILILQFLILFFIMDKKIRKFNIERIYNSLKIFIKIVMPLLIIAAIIEGLLITAL